MMGIQPSEAKVLTLWEYGALVTTWSERHDPEGASQPVEAPDPEMVARQQRKLVERGLARMH